MRFQSDTFIVETDQMGQSSIPSPSHQLPHHTNHCRVLLNFGCSRVPITCTLISLEQVSEHAVTTALAPQQIALSDQDVIYLCQWILVDWRDVALTLAMLVLLLPPLRACYYCIVVYPFASCLLICFWNVYFSFHHIHWLGINRNHKRPGNGNAGQVKRKTGKVLDVERQVVQLCVSFIIIVVWWLLCKRCVLISLKVIIRLEIHACGLMSLSGWQYDYSFKFCNWLAFGCSLYFVSKSYKNTLNAESASY